MLQNSHLIYVMELCLRAKLRVGGYVTDIKRAAQPFVLFFMWAFLCGVVWVFESKFDWRGGGWTGYYFCDGIR